MYTEIKNRPTSIDELDPDTKRDLKRQLDHNRREIQEKYASFVVSLYGAVEATGVTLNKFRLYLMGLSAFESEHEGKGEQPIILDSVKAQIENANSIVGIFETLTTDFCSYINIGVFQSIIDRYEIDTDSNEDLQYSSHLKAYLKNHKISEFIMINPRFRRISKDSEKLSLKFNVALPDNINKVLDLKCALADVFGLKPSALQLAGIEKGSVIVNFLIPITVATCIFASGLTAKQEADIRALSVLWLECRNYKLEEIPQGKEIKDVAQVKGSRKFIHAIQLS